jgi:hypothetical protein
VPGAVALNAVDIDQARIEVAQLWQASEARQPVDRVPDGYEVLDTNGFVKYHVYVRGKYAPT